MGLAYPIVEHITCAALVTNTLAYISIASIAKKIKYIIGSDISIKSLKRKT